MKSFPSYQSVIKKSKLNTRRRVATTVVVIFLMSFVAASQGWPDDVGRQALTDGDTLRLEQVLRTVLDRNGDVSSARLMAEASFKMARSLGAWEDPMLMMGISNLPTSMDFKEDMMTMAMFGLSQNIPYAGQNRIRAKAQSLAAEAAWEEMRTTQANLILQAKLAYYGASYRQQSLRDQAAQIELLHQVLASAIAGLKVALIKQADVAAIQAEISRQEAETLMARQQLDSALFELYALMGEALPDSFPYFEPLDVDTVSGDVAVWVTQAETNFPPLRKASKEAQWHRQTAKAARRERWPMLGIGVYYGWRFDTPDEERRDMLGANLSLTLPIFSPLRQKNEVAAATAMALGAEAEKRQLQREVAAELAALKHQQERLLSAWQLYQQRIIPASMEAFRSALAGYTNGLISLGDLLDYAAKIFADRAKASQIAFDLAMTKAEIEKYTIDPASYAVVEEGQ